MNCGPYETKDSTYPMCDLWSVPMYWQPVSPVETTYPSYQQSLLTYCYTPPTPEEWTAVTCSPVSQDPPCPPETLDKQSRRRSKKPKDKKKCNNCGATNTPSWRRSMKSAKLLCNACGLYEKVNGRRRVVMVHPDGSMRVSRGATQGKDTDRCVECNVSDAKRWHMRNQGRLCDRCVGGEKCCMLV